MTEAATQETTQETSQTATAVNQAETTVTDNSAASDWRQRYGDDPKLQKTLARYTSEPEVGKALMEARARISAGDLLKPLPADAKPEDVAAYREQLGIPAEPKGYLENLPQGLNLAEDDVDVAEGIAAALHATNARPEAVHAVLGWYKNQVETQAAEVQRNDALAAQAVTEELREVWGVDYRANINIVQAFLQSNFDDVTREALLNARLPDGTALMNNAEVLKSLANMGREANPLSVIMAAGVTDMKGLDQELAEIESKMGTHAYYKDKKMQARYGELLEMKQRIESRQK